MGSLDAVVHPFDGRIDELRVWNYKRSVDELAYWKDRVLSGNQQGLVLYVRGENNSNDSSSKANHLTEDSTPTYPGDPAF